MAVEIIPPKQLHKHALPVIMITAILMILPAAAMNASVQGADTIVHGLVARLIKVQPTPNGLARITLNNSAGSTVNPPAGSYLEDNPGRIAQLSLQL